MALKCQMERNITVVSVVSFFPPKKRNWKMRASFNGFRVSRVGPKLAEIISASPQFELWYWRQGRLWYAYLVCDRSRRRSLHIISQPRALTDGHQNRYPGYNVLSRTQNHRWNVASDGKVDKHTLCKIRPALQPIFDYYSLQLLSVARACRFGWGRSNRYNLNSLHSGLSIRRSAVAAIVA